MPSIPKLEFSACIFLSLGVSLPRHCLAQSQMCPIAATCRSVTLMALMANVMMTGAESSGCLLGIPEDVMGLTVTAAGTSLPNLFASLMVAKREYLAPWVTHFVFVF